MSGVKYPILRCQPHNSNYELNKKGSREEPLIFFKFIG